MAYTRSSYYSANINGMVTLLWNETSLGFDNVRILFDVSPRLIAFETKASEFTQMILLWVSKFLEAVCNNVIFTYVLNILVNFSIIIRDKF